jgi:hypothetical protein
MRQPSAASPYLGGGDSAIITTLARPSPIFLFRGMPTDRTYRIVTIGGDEYFSCMRGIVECVDDNEAINSQAVSISPLRAGSAQE